jgi:hypothetical protein
MLYCRFLTCVLLNFVSHVTKTRFENRSRHKLKRVCLELYSVVRMKLLYKRWKTLIKLIKRVEVERTELANVRVDEKRIGLPQTTVRRSLQITLCCGNRKRFWW